MMPHTPTTGAVRLFIRSWRNCLALVPVALSFGYAVFILVDEWKPHDRMLTFSGSTPILQSLLFRRGTRVDLYDIPSQKIIRTTTPFEDAQEIARPARLLSTKAILVFSERRARVRDMISPYTYDPLAGQTSPLVHTSRNTNFVFALTDGGRDPSVRITFAGCGDIAEVPLPASAEWYEPAPLFEALGVPQQRRMTLSPAETELAVIDHASLPRIAIVHLTQRTALTLSVPSFDPEQVHFSPFFVDDRTLLFSVIDRNHWGTVLYRIPDGNYEVLSPTFTDAAYHSATGKVILVQSYFENALNVPFGSVVLLEERRGIAAGDIETIVGPRDTPQARAILSLLFQNPDGSVLRFRRDLTNQSFNGIADANLRESLRALWNERRLVLQNAVGTFQILRLEPDRTLSRIDTVSFTIQPPAAFTAFTQNMEPLLRALETPDYLLEQYRKRSADAAKGGEEYLLVDDLSY